MGYLHALVRWPTALDPNCSNSSLPFKTQKNHCLLWKYSLILPGRWLFPALCSQALTLL